MVEAGREITLEVEEESSSRGGRGRNPTNVAGRGKNQNSSHPSGQRFDK